MDELSKMRLDHDRSGGERLEEFQLGFVAAVLYIEGISFPPTPEQFSSAVKKMHRYMGAQSLDS